MIFKETKLKDAYIIELELIEDNRGFFARTWCKEEFDKLGLNSNLVQCNLSYNLNKGTIRGLHYQKEPFQETKLVRCISGSIYDVIVDLRPHSQTFLQWVGIELSAKNYQMLYVPEGFAHGYQTLEDNTEVFYQVTEFYKSSHEKGIRWDDRDINIHWPLTSNLIISDKDKGHPGFKS